MKKIISLLVLALMVQGSFAQAEKEPARSTGEEPKSDMQTIFTKDNLKITGGYLAPEVKMGYVHEDASLLLGAKLGMTFNNKFTLGLAGYGLTNNSNFDINNDPSDPARIGMGYGGLAMEYTLFSDKKIHFSIPVVLGVAGIYIYEDDGDYFNSTWDEIENTAALVVEPGINIELNLFKFFRVDLGASYRLVSQTDLPVSGLSDKDLSDITLNATFKFGFF